MPRRKLTLCLALSLLAGCARLPSNGQAFAAPGTPDGNSLLLFQIRAGATANRPLTAAEGEKLIQAVGASGALAVSCNHATRAEADSTIEKAARVTAARTPGATEATLLQLARVRQADPALVRSAADSTFCTDSASTWYAAGRIADGKSLAALPVRVVPSDYNLAALSQQGNAGPKAPQSTIAPIESTEAYVRRIEREEAKARRTREAKLEAEWKRVGAADDRARNDAWLLGKAKACWLLTAGDVQYAEPFVVANARKLVTSGPEPTELSRRFRDGLESAERNSVGPTDYDCARYGYEARAMIRRYGGTELR